MLPHDKDYDTPIKLHDSQLHSHILSLFRKLLHLDKSQYIDRAILKANEYATTLFIAVDGSATGFGACCHFRITNKHTKATHTRLIRAAQKFHKDTVPTNELNAIWLGARLLCELILAFSSFMPKQEFESLNYYIVNDSMSTALQFLRAPKSGQQQRLVAKVNRILHAIDRSLNKVEKLEKCIHFMWVDSSNMAADSCSKEQNSFNPTSLWLNGPTIYLQQQWQDNIWSTFIDGKFTKATQFKYWNQNTQLTNPINVIMTRNQKIRQIKDLTTTPFITTLRLGKVQLWNPHEIIHIPTLSQQSFEEYTNKSNCHSKNVSILASVLEAISAFKKNKTTTRTFYLKQAHQAIIKYAQTIKPVNLAKSYKQTTINQLQCITVNIGESINTQNHIFFLPVVTLPELAKQILWSAHRQLIPSTPGSPAHFFHHQKNATIANTKQPPFLSYISSVQGIATELLLNCKICNHAHAVSYKSHTLTFQHLIKQETFTLFSAISIDCLGPVELATKRSNMTKKHWILPVVCLLTGCMELYLLTDMTESSVLFALLVLQQTWNPIVNILSDAGSNLQNLGISGEHKLTGESLRLFSLLKKNEITAVLNQKANLVEGNIRKLKFLFKTFSNNNVKESFRNLQPMAFQVVLAYFKSALESIPYQNESTLCPKLVKGQSITLPLELYVETDKFKFFQTTKKHMVHTLQYFLKLLQTSHLNKPNFFYNTTTHGRHTPMVDDVVMVKAKSDFESKNKIGIVVKVDTGRKLVSVKFSNGHTTTFPSEALVMLCRASPLINSSNRNSII